MWLKFTETYIGPLGSFTKGMRFDIINKDAVDYFLDKKIATKTCPPWEDNVDKKQVRFRQMTTEVSQLTEKLIKAKVVFVQTQKTVQTLPELKKKVDLLKGELEKAKTEMRKFAADNKIKIPKELDGKTDEKTG